MTIRLKYGKTNTYFVRGTGRGLLIDTDYAGIANMALQLQQINYVLSFWIMLYYCVATNYERTKLWKIDKLR